MVKLELLRYRLRMRPLVLGDRIDETREGLLLRAMREDGRIASSDAAPLPGYSYESRAIAEKSLTAWIDALPRFDAVSLHHLPSACPPSAAFAIETLSETVQRWDAIIPARMMDVRLNALIIETAENTPSAALDAAAKGYTCVKIKSGAWTPELAASTALQVREAVGPDISIRMDASRAWDFETAYAVADKFRDAALAYIEEPIREVDRLAELAGRTGIPIALDETLISQTNPEAFARANPWVRAFVLKPTLLGGLTVARQWASAAASIGADAVVSAAFESGVGLTALGRLAVELGAGRIPAGLDTYAWLLEDVWSPALSPVNGCLTAADIEHPSRQWNTPALELIHERTFSD